MKTTLDQIRIDYGSITNYLLNVVQVSESVLADLQRGLLVDLKDVGVLETRNESGVLNAVSMDEKKCGILFNWLGLNGTPSEDPKNKIPCFRPVTNIGLLKHSGNSEYRTCGR
ncbi:hypothetical protein HDU76_004792 [Blyttiomyces sp. JEL0837]|nr:hypothetical protein HDU76_004792 [Blyttiomyces sp. JEL0837]